METVKNRPRQTKGDRERKKDIHREKSKEREN